jgi:hypothetical protein
MKVNKDLLRASQRWQALKPKELEVWTPEAVEKVFATLVEWEETVKDLQQQAQTLRDNSASFAVRAAVVLFRSRCLLPQLPHALCACCGLPAAGAAV